MRMYKLTATVLMLGLIQWHCSGCSDSGDGSTESNSNSAASSPTEWYVMIDGVQTGPFSEALVIREAASGCLGEETQVWRTGQGDWEDLSKAIPDLTFGGSRSAGRDWAELFDGAAELREPSSPNSSEPTASEQDAWLARNESLIGKVWSMSGRFGPEPDKGVPTTNRLGGSRAITRLLRMDAQRSLEKGEIERASGDLDAMGSLAHQQWITTGPVDANQPSLIEVFELGPLVSIASMSVMMQVIQNSGTPSSTPKLRSRAMESLKWVDARRLKVIRDHCAKFGGDNSVCEELLALLEERNAS